MADVVLVRPRSNIKAVMGMPRIPLALLYIGSILKENGYTIEVIDTHVEQDYKEHTINACRNALVVGISALTSEVRNGLEIGRLVKSNCDVPIVWGGIHPSLFPEMTCRDELVDFVCCGEGEHVMLALTSVLKGSGSLDSVDGLVYKNGSSINKNHASSYINLDDMPTIDYTLVDMGRYFEEGTWRKAVDVQTSRGCPFHCKFCVANALGNHTVRLMSADRVIDECERLVKDYGVDYITFIDDNFFIDKKRAGLICDGLRKLNLEWFAEVRANFFRDGFIDSDFLKLAEASGLRNLTIGAESGVPHCLEEMAKGITVDDIMNSAKMLSKTKISAAYSFIIGLPNETEQDIMQTADFVREISRVYPHAVFNIGVLRAYPKTEFTEYFMKQGWIQEPKSLAEFAVRHHSRVYTDRMIKPIWHKNPNFAHSVACCAEVAFNSFNREGVRKHLKGALVLLIPEILLQKLALWRLRHRFFRFKVDVYVFRLLHYLYFSKLVRRVARWAR